METVKASSPDDSGRAPSPQGKSKREHRLRTPEHVCLSEEGGFVARSCPSQRLVTALPPGFIHIHHTRARGRPFFYWPMYVAYRFSVPCTRPRTPAHPFACVRGCGGCIPGVQDAVAAGGPANALQEPGVYAEDGDRRRRRGGGRGGRSRLGLASRGREEEEVVVDVDVRLTCGKGDRGRGLGWVGRRCFAVRGSLWWCRKGRRRLSGGVNPLLLGEVCGACNTHTQVQLDSILGSRQRCLDGGSLWFDQTRRGDRC